MEIQRVIDFFNPTYPGENTLNMGLPRALSLSEEKTLRTAMVTFNLTPRKSNLIASYNMQHTKQTLSESLLSGNLKAWSRLALFIASIALLVFSSLRLSNYISAAYYDAYIKIASGNHVTAITHYGRVISTRKSIPEDFLDTQYLISTSWILFCSVICAVSTIELLRTLPIKASIQLSIRQFERILPTTLSNSIAQSGNYEDPITLEEIPMSQIESPAFLYLSNSVISSAACMRAILEKPTIRDQDGYERYTHPLESHTLSIGESAALDENIDEIFGRQAADIGLGLFCPTAHSAEWKKAAFLGLFNENIRNCLPQFFEQ